MFLTGFTNHLLITFHLRRCQYHIKVINDLRQFCITVGFRVYFNAILKELQKDKNYDRIVISEDLEAFTNTQYSQIDKFIFDKFIIHYFQTYIYPPSFLPTRKGMD